MPIVPDPYSILSLPWGGTDFDDTLVYAGGDDVIAGGEGYDILVLPFNYSDCIVGDYRNQTINIQTPTGRIYVDPFDSATAIGIEELQFNDFSYQLESRPEPEPALYIEFGTGGYWTTNKALGRSEGWTTKGGRTKKYLIDNDWGFYTREDIGDLPLVLNGGNWDDTVVDPGFGGSFIRAGKNVIAFFDGMTVDEVWNLTYIYN